MTVAWTTPAAVLAALGSPSTPAPDDPFLVDCCAAANDASWRKRHTAGYDDPAAAGSPAPTADVAMGATRWALGLWRARASTDGFASFEDLSSFSQTFGDWGEIKRLLGIGRAAVDGIPADADVINPLLARRRRRGLARLGRAW